MANPARVSGAIKPKVVRFNLYQLTVALLKEAECHEGLWQLQVAFGQTATNISINGKMTPAAIVQVMGMQLARADKPGELTVDAAEVNPESRIIVPTNIN